MNREFEAWFDKAEHPGPVGYAKRAFEAGQASVSPTLRDQFAMAALQGYRANSNKHIVDWNGFDVAVAAYDDADRMLEERDKR